MSKKTLISIICLIIVLLTLKRENSGLEDAEALLIARMLENDRAVEVFGMSREGVYT